MTRLGRRIQQSWRTRPRIALTLRAAVAAAVAWVAVSLLPGLADQYPYYAPFGAVIATTFTLASSVKESARAVIAIVLGGAVAWVVDLLIGTTSPVSVGLVVAVGVALAGLRWLGAMGSWVPTAAIFTLIIGQGETSFAGAYAGLTLLGACIGIGVNAAFPPLPLGAARHAVTVTRRRLADQLLDLATHLEAGDFPSMAHWWARHRDLDRARTAMRSAVAQAQESRRANRRAPRHAVEIEEVIGEADAVDRLCFLASDLSDLILRDHVAPGPAVEPTRLPYELRAPIVEALRLLSEALTSRDSETKRHELTEVDDRLAAVVERIASRAHGPDQLILNSVVLTLRRGLDTFADDVGGTDATGVGRN